MSEPSFQEKLAMMKFEQSSHSKEIKRLDELSDKEKTGNLTNEEKKEINILDRLLMPEYKRCLLHYQVNWNFMSQDIKGKLIKEVNDWWENGKSANTHEERSTP